jgi:hypothetical protein
MWKCQAQQADVRVVRKRLINDVLNAGGVAVLSEFNQSRGSANVRVVVTLNDGAVERKGGNSAYVQRELLKCALKKSKR